VTLFAVGVALYGTVNYPSIIRNLNVSIEANRALMLLTPEDVVTSAIHVGLHDTSTARPRSTCDEDEAEQSFIHISIVSPFNPHRWCLHGPFETAATPRS
jgi:hypothetical protein